MEQPKEFTLGDLARHFKTGIWRIRYAAKTYGIAPRKWLGGLRIWSEEDLPAFQRALDQMAANRATGRFTPAAITCA